jgi:hypothetical protein
MSRESRWLGLMFIVLLVGGAWWSTVPGVASAPVPATPATPIPAAVGGFCPDTRDFLRLFFGAYVPRDQRVVTDTEVGPQVGIVTEGHQDPPPGSLTDACGGDPSREESLCPSGNDGKAPALETGTPIYALLPYDPRFRVVVRRDERWVKCEIQCNRFAREGGDVLDIREHVVGIGIYLDITQPCGRITDPTLVTELVEMVLDGAVVDLPPHVNNPPPAGLRLRVDFELDDGTQVSSALIDLGHFRLGTRGNKLPEELVTTIREHCTAG